LETEIERRIGVEGGSRVCALVRRGIDDRGELVGGERGGPFVVEGETVGTGLKEFELIFFLKENAFVVGRQVLIEICRGELQGGGDGPAGGEEGGD